MMGVRQFEIIKTIHWDANTGTLQIQYIQRARKHYKYSTRSISDAPALQIQCIQRLWLAEASDHAANFANRYGKDRIKKTWIQKSTNIQNGLGVIYLQPVDDNGNDAYSYKTATGIKVTSCNKIPCDPTTGEGYMKTTFAVEKF